MKNLLFPWCNPAARASRRWRLILFHEVLRSTQDKKLSLRGKCHGELYFACKMAQPHKMKGYANN